MKEGYLDTRGRESNIARVGRFDPGALAHMLSYRILIILSIPLGAVLLWGFVAGVGAPVLDALVVVVWLLATPQLFQSLKALSLISTDGASFGGFDEGYARRAAKTRGGRGSPFFDALPYMALVVWVLLLAVFIVGAAGGVI